MRLQVVPTSIFVEVRILKIMTAKRASRKHMSCDESVIGPNWPDRR